MTALVEEMNRDEASRMLRVVGVAPEQLDHVVGVAHRTAQASGRGFIDVVTQAARVFASGRLTALEVSFLSDMGILNPRMLAEHLGLDLAETYARLQAGGVDAAAFLAALELQDGSPESGADRG